jgi:hypothetical protein
MGEMDWDGAIGERIQWFSVPMTHSLTWTITPNGSWMTQWLNDSISGMGARPGSERGTPSGWLALFSWPPFRILTFVWPTRWRVGASFDSCYTDYSAFLATGPEETLRFARRMPEARVSSIWRLERSLAENWRATASGETGAGALPPAIPLTRVMLLRTR